MPDRTRRIALAAAVMIACVAIDLWTKAIAWEHLRDEDPIVVVEGFFVLDFVFNTGSAFGFLQHQRWGRLFFIAVTLGALGYLAFLLRALPHRHASAFVAIGLIAGGAIGNLHDRVMRSMEILRHTRHGVVDFIVVYYWPGKRWPAFNVADAVLVAGVLLFMIYLRRHGEDDRAASEHTGD